MDFNEEDYNTIQIISYALEADAVDMEPFEDENQNGIFDEGEKFSDRNRNGLRDSCLLTHIRRKKAYLIMTAWIIIV